MTEVYHRARPGQGSDPSRARACLDRFIEAADALEEAWDPVLDRSTYPGYLPSFEEFVSALHDWQAEVHGRLALEDREPDPVNFADPAAVRAWIAEMRTQIEDAASAGEDATRPLGKRRLGRMMARRMAVEAHDAGLSLLRAAELGLG
jgi:hypothetical protein